MAIVKIDQVKMMLNDIIDNMEPPKGIQWIDYRKEWLRTVIKASEELIESERSTKVRLGITT